GKTCGAWGHDLHPDTGALTQTSPLGQSYTTRPLPPLCGRLDGGPPDPATRRAGQARRSRLRRHLRGLDTLFPDPPGAATSPLEQHLAALLHTDA
ncbi:MAG TPA: hypothetical protein VK894_04665, partial [Jiangellales bacterium]|nr:hypothetical protein [Jiangellales bacterium]